MNRTAAALAGALALSLVAVPASADARAARPAVSIHVTTTKHVAGPDTLRPGLVRLRNTGSKPIYVLRRLKASWGVTTLVKDYNSSSPTGFARHFRSYEVLPGRRDSFVPMARGTFFLVDGALTRISAANVRTVVVKGTTWNAPKPVSTAVPISGTAATLGAPATLPTHRYLHFSNPTGYTVVVLLFRVGAKTSDSALAAFVAKPTLKGLGRLDLRSTQELWYASPKVSLYYGYQATAGRYLMIDYAYTDPAKLPRFGKGQAVAVRVS